MEAKKKPFHQVVAEKLIEQLKEGVAPWQKPWQPGEPGAVMPFNPTTGKRYKGINAIQLMSQGHDDQRWMTYKQAVAVDAQVRKGEKGTPIQFWKFSEEQIKTDGNGRPVRDAQGELVKQNVALERPRVFMATVFNAEQIDGLLPIQARKKEEQTWTAVDRAEQILQASGAVIRHSEQNRAFYMPTTDAIHLPNKAQFPSADNYYATALHELGHWTGHETRLDRDLIHPFGSAGYAKEELRAEIASMILGDELGIGHDPDQHAAYVGSWITALQDDPLEIFRAAADAEKIQNYVLGLEQKQVQEQTKQQEETMRFKDQWAIRDGLNEELRPHGLQVHFEASEALGGLNLYRQDGTPVMIRTTLGDTVQGFPWETSSAAIVAWWDQHEHQETQDTGRLVDKLEASGVMSRPDAVVTSALRDLRTGTAGTQSIDIEALNEATKKAFGSTLDDATKKKFGFHLPRDWNGNIQVQGNVNVEIDGKQHATSADSLGVKPVFWSVYAQQQGGLDQWLVDFPAQRQADELAERLALIGAYAETNEYEQAAKLARLNEERVRRDPNSTEEDKSNAKEHRKDAQFAAVYNDADLQRRMAEIERRYEDTDSLMQFPALPAQMTIEEFSQIAMAVPLVDHGRRWEVFVGQQSYGFSDAATSVAAVLDAHEREVNNALYSRSTDNTGIVDVQAMPPERVLSQYPELQTKFSDTVNFKLGEEENFYRQMTEIRAKGAKNWTPDEAKQQAILDLDTYQNSGDETERKFIADDMASNSEVNLDYRGALEMIAFTRGVPMESMPGKTMVYNAKPGMAGAEVVSEDGSRLCFGGREAIEVFAAENKLLAEDVKVLLEMDSYADKYRSAAPAARPEKTLINVPFKEKDAAKALGAKWDRQEQSWYVPAGVDAAPFAKWAQGTAAASGVPERQEPAQRQALPSEASQGRVYLAVPYNDRIEAKAAGAEWDKGAKSWYAGSKADMEKLARWKPENVSNQQDPAMTPEKEFADALVSLGCVVSGTHPIMDGQKHRISVVGEQPSEKAGSGFYVGHLDGHPAGYIKNNKTGLDMKWKSKGYSLDPEQKAQLAAEAASKLQAREIDQARVHEQTAQRVKYQLADLIEVEQPTPYMLAKGIDPQPGVFTDRGGQKTYIPAIDANNKQWSMQYIQEDGTKRFAKDSRKEGCFAVIGGIDALALAPALVIGEGYATAGTLSQSLGFATVAAFDSGNLLPVAKALQQKFPDKPIFIAGDDDRHLEITLGTNPGKTKAQEAAQATGGKVLLPIFAPGENNYPPDLAPVTPEKYREHQSTGSTLSVEQIAALTHMKRMTDFNDLANKSTLGQEGVARQVKYAVYDVIEKSQARIAENRALIDPEEKAEKQKKPNPPKLNMAEKRHRRIAQI